ncbi:MAG: glycosyltransferase family 2 protein [Paracoccaceae bacterium]
MFREATQRVQTNAPTFRPKSARPIGQILVDQGCLTDAELAHGLDLQRQADAPLGDILIYEGMIRARDLHNALAEQHGLTIADLSRFPPEPDLVTFLSPDLCFQHGVVPWRRFGDILLVATARPDQFEHLDADETLVMQPVLCNIADIRKAQARLFGPTLALRAEKRVPRDMSCRGFDAKPMLRNVLGAVLLLCLCAGLFFVPNQVWILFSWLAVVTLAISIFMKTISAMAALTKPDRLDRIPDDIKPLRLPQVSMLVPLLHERRIAEMLIARLSKLTYPKALLDVVLVLEADDSVTQDTVSRTDLPPWMRVIEVPRGSGLKTKPRALNYALDFCRGSIVGVWDAEDAPEADQIEKVVTQFHLAPSETVCLQGRLDYYNAKANWMARCFTIEYATWWRLTLAGLARLGWVIPLGGTTLFFRRSVLEDLGGWDAHNVTEDADLGLRLARAGYRTELIDTVTYEEANCRPWPWVRQRSRWLKGFALTWAAHMRTPLKLLKDLGLYRFLGVQIFFIASLSQFFLAPVFWSFWLIIAGLAHPFADWAGSFGILTFFLVCELISIAIHAIAVRGPQHRHLIPWAPTMLLYFPLGCIAMYKALYEIITSPFYWDKTEHGVE